MIAYADVVTGTGAYPPARTLTGTIETYGSTGKVMKGVGTAFKSELIGKYVYANDQCRKIIGVKDATYLFIEKPFTAPVAATAFLVVDTIGGQISFVNKSTNEITVNDGTYAGNVSNAFTNQPIWYVLGANEMQIDVQFP